MFVFLVTYAFRISSTKSSRNTLVVFTIDSTSTGNWVSHLLIAFGWYEQWFHVCDLSCCFSCQQFRCRYAYYAFDEVALFVDCLLQKIKKSSVLPLVEQWEEYMAVNLSESAARAEEQFLDGTRIFVILESWQLLTEKRVSARWEQVPWGRFKLRFCRLLPPCLLKFKTCVASALL